MCTISGPRPLSTGGILFATNSAPKRGLSSATPTASTTPYQWWPSPPLLDPPVPSSSSYVTLLPSPSSAAANAPALTAATSGGSQCGSGDGAAIVSGARLPSSRQLSRNAAVLNVGWAWIINGRGSGRECFEQL
jgi:hypothetical protein